MPTGPHHNAHDPHGFPPQLREAVRGLEAGETLDLRWRPMTKNGRLSARGWHGKVAWSPGLAANPEAAFMGALSNLGWPSGWGSLGVRKFIYSPEAEGFVLADDELARLAEGAVLLDENGEKIRKVRGYAGHFTSWLWLPDWSDVYDDPDADDDATAMRHAVKEWTGLFESGAAFFQAVGPLMTGEADAGGGIADLFRGMAAMGQSMEAGTAHRPAEPEPAPEPQAGAAPRDPLARFRALPAEQQRQVLAQLGAAERAALGLDGSE